MTFLTLSGKLREIEICDVNTSSNNWLCREFVLEFKNRDYFFLTRNVTNRILNKLRGTKGSLLISFLLL